MFLYITLGTNDLVRARAFYTPLMASIGQVLRIAEDTGIGYGPPEPSRIALWITRPYDGKPATVGNGSMPAFDALTRSAVNAFHRAALAHGGTDEGAPGLRYSANFYSCYVRDPDGNKLSAVCERPE